MAVKYRKVLLASNSPRRQELLDQLGVNYELVKNDFDETILPNEAPLDYVERLALGKAQSAKKSISKLCYPILAADTIVVLAGQILGKPENLDHAKNMLAKLSGNQHQVFTSLVLLDNENTLQRTNQSLVSFESLDSKQIEAYCATQEPLGKAGSYAIQGVAASFIELLEGSYSGVMGLPLNDTRQLLDKLGVKHLLN